jgi:hypothetical protein
VFQLTAMEIEMRNLACCIVAVLLPMTSRLALTVSSATITVKPQQSNHFSFMLFKAGTFFNHVFTENKVEIFIKSLSICFLEFIQFVLRHFGISSKIKLKT